MGGPWNDEDADMTINNNIYWHYTKGADGIIFRYLNFSEWNKRGYDEDSYIIDPMFTDPENRDFSFKDDTNIKKIGFEVFSLNFGVLGEKGDSWYELANNENNNIFHENQVLPPSIFFTSGSTDFEEENDSFLKNCTIKQQHSTIEFTEIEKYSGTKSLRFASATKAQHSNVRPEILVPCNYEQGRGTFSFWFYVKDIKNKVLIVFDSFLYITIYDGKIYSSGNSFDFSDYEINTWNKISIYIDFGNSKTKSTYDIELNGVKKTGQEISYTTLTNFEIQMEETKDDTYIDDLVCETDYKIPNYFSETYDANAELFNAIKYKDLPIHIDDNNEEEKDESNNGDIDDNTDDGFNIVLKSQFYLILLILLFV